MIIKIGDIVKWGGEEFLVVGNESEKHDRVQLREVTDAGYDVEIKEIDKQIKQEIADGVIMDPMAMQALEMGLGEDPMTDGTALPAENGAANGGSTADPKSSISSGDQKRAEF